MPRPKCFHVGRLCGSSEKEMMVQRDWISDEIRKPGQNYVSSSSTFQSCRDVVGDKQAFQRSFYRYIVIFNRTGWITAQNKCTYTKYAHHDMN
eukprot:scaffold2012_cov193-Cylindrotheca_fusiformis.AAC.13